MIKFAKYQIHFYILPTFSETFIEIKQVWSQPQPQKELEGKFKIYTLSLFCSNKSDYWQKVSLSLRDLSQINSWILKNCRYQTWKCLLDKNKFHKPLISLSWFKITGVRSGESMINRCVNFELDLQWPWRL